MNIFGINGGELLILIVLALLLLGPEKIPEYLRTLREWVHKIRQLAEGAKAQFKEETGTDFDDVDWQKYDPRQYDPRRVIREALSEPIEDLEASLHDAKSTVQDAADTVLDKPDRPQLTQAQIMAAAVPIDQLEQQADVAPLPQFPDPAEPAGPLVTPEETTAAAVGAALPVGTPDETTAQVGRATTPFDNEAT